MRRTAPWLAIACSTLLISRSLAQAGADEPQAVAPLPPVMLDAPARQVVAASNAFTLDLFRAASEPGQNAVLSPASVSVAVGFAYRGARGETAAQLRQVLHYPFEPAEYLRAGRAVLDSLEFTATGRELHAVNSLWTQTGMPFDAGYESDLAAYGKGGLNRIDFKSDGEKARDAINGWVGTATRGKIPELLKPSHITKDTRSALVNALYFKGQWAHPFAKAQTDDQSFRGLNGTKRTVKMMHDRWTYPAIHRDGAKAIALPYVGYEISLIALMPDDPAGLPKFERELARDGLTKWLKALDQARGRETILSLPRISLKAERNLAKAIAGMGAPLPFSDLANFSGMAQLPYPGGNPDETGLKIGPIVHAATLDVDENGSEAAAATAVLMEMMVTGTRPAAPSPPPFVFNARQPFLFLLRDNRTGLILFIGRYVGPDA